MEIYLEHTSVHVRNSISFPGLWEDVQESYILSFLVSICAIAMGPIIWVSP